MRDTSFYDEESVQYSQKRYPKVATNYTQYFYLRRLEIVRKYLAKFFSGKSFATFLEIGCADGVVLRAVAEFLPGVFGKMIGIDISEKMVEEAQRQNHILEAQFFLRSQLPSKEGFDVVLEVGVVNYAVFEEELSFAKDHIKDNGYYLLSVAGTDSLKNRMKGEDGFNNFRSYRAYEETIKHDFKIKAETGCGVFVPYLWRIPGIARVIQPIFEVMANTLGMTGLCHEKIYLLKKKSSHSV